MPVRDPRIRIVNSIPDDSIEIKEYITTRTKYEFLLYYSKSEDKFYQKIDTGYSERFPSSTTNTISIKLNNGKYTNINVKRLISSLAHE